MKLTGFEAMLIQRIKKLVERGNLDNISRTKCYESFYFNYPEITWSLLAGIVSRNAGWHMCDLKGPYLSRILKPSFRQKLFYILEKAYWLIFRDAYPQLLVYHYSTLWKMPLFHILPYFSVSKFMQNEWERFWGERNSERLLYALIINEQNVIQKPLIEYPDHQEILFRSLIYRMQERFSFCYVLLPSAYGTLYGFPVNDFTDVHKRIELGKRLAQVLFSPHLFPEFKKFVQSVEPTGARWDYEQKVPGMSRSRSWPLRLTYPVIYHEPVVIEPWDQVVPIQQKWFQSPSLKTIDPITHHFMKKQKEIEYLSYIKRILAGFRK